MKPGSIKVVYMDFWASWCGPCGQSLPFLNELQSQMKNQGLEVVAVNLDENRQDADEFLAKHPVGLTIAADPEGHCPNAYGVQAMPSSFLIDRHGKVRHIHLGFRPGDRDGLRNHIAALLAEK
jgi:thiol-disulfide isomerase/thioredoxin